MQAENLQNTAQLEAQLTKIEFDLQTIEKRFVLGEITQELFSKYSEQFLKEVIKIKKELRHSTFNLSNLEKAVDKAKEYALQLPVLWENGGLIEKRRIQKMVFPNGIVYDFKNSTYRTQRVNELFSYFPLFKMVLVEKKKGTIAENLLLPPFVLGAGLEPARPYRHRILSPACLPIPPSERTKKYIVRLEKSKRRYNL